MMITRVVPSSSWMVMRMPPRLVLADRGERERLRFLSPRLSLLQLDPRRSIVVDGVDAALQGGTGSIGRDVEGQART